MFRFANNFTRSSEANSEATSRIPWLTFVDFWIASSMLAVPLIYGGRYAVGHLVLSISAGMATVFWCLRKIVRRSTKVELLPAYLLGLAAVAIVTAQVLPLSSEWVLRISPGVGQLLPVWFQSEPVFDAQWSTVSLAPAETRAGLTTLISYVLLFFVVTQRVRRVEDVRRILKWIAIATIAMMLFGLLQHYAGNGKFFWVLEPPFRKRLWAISGTFTSRNHFIHFLALGLGPMLYWLLHGWKPPVVESRGRSFRRESFNTGALSYLQQHRHWVAAVPAVALFITALLSQSRGGLVAVVVALLVFFLVSFRPGQLKGRIASVSIVSVLSLGVFLFFYGDDFLHGRIETLLSGDLREMDVNESRKSIWAANVEAWENFPVLGTGVGTHREVYHSFLETIDHEMEFTHAESGYLQIASETGTSGLLILAFAIGLCAYWCISSRRKANSAEEAAVVAAISASLVASLVHSVADFVWYIPGCMATTVVLMACANRSSRLAVTNDIPHRRSVPRGVFVMASCAVTVLVGWTMHVNLMQLKCELPWQEYVRKSMRGNKEIDLETEQSRLHLLKQAIQANPDSARVHMRLATVHLTLFGLLQEENSNPMSLAQVRDAAMHNGFESAAAVNEWLEVALGDNLQHLHTAQAHARRAVELCPLQGQAYLHLAKTSFLNNSPKDRMDTLLAQSLTVRPADGHVLFSAGQFAWLAGDVDLAVERWSRAFRFHAGYRQLIIEIMADYVPAKFFLENFNPDIEALSSLQNHYRLVERTQDRNVILRRQAELAFAEAQKHRGEEAIRYWLLAHEACDALQAKDHAEQCFQRALDVDPGSFKLRDRYGRWLFRQQRYAEASTHLSWCANRRPDDRKLQELAELTLKRRVETASAKFDVKR